jgi:hypothetical protein
VEHDGMKVIACIVVNALLYIDMVVAFPLLTLRTSPLLCSGRAGCAGIADRFNERCKRFYRFRPKTTFTFGI